MPVQRIQVALYPATLGDERLALFTNLIDSLMGDFEPCCIFIILPLVFGLIQRGVGVGADMPLHEPRDNLQIGLQGGVFRCKPLNVAAFIQCCLADSEDLHLVVNDLIDYPDEGFL